MCCSVRSEEFKYYIVYQGCLFVPLPGDTLSTFDCSTLTNQEVEEQVFIFDIELAKHQCVCESVSVFICLLEVSVVVK